MLIKKLLFGRDGMCPYCLSKLNEENIKPDESRRTKCPYCENYLDGIDIFDYEKAISIGFVGYSRSGKSCLTLAMIYELMYSSNGWFDVSPMIYDDTANDFYNNLNKVRENKEIAATNITSIDKSILRLKVCNRHVRHRSRMSTYSLCVFDPKGGDTIRMKSRDFDNSDEKNSDKKDDADLVPLLFKNTQNYILIIDGTKLDDNFSGSYGADPDTGVKMLNDLMRSMDELHYEIAKHRHLKPGSVLDVNLAVVVSKIDALGDDDLGSNSRLRMPSLHFLKGVFDTNDADGVDREIRALLQRKKAGFLMNSLNFKFKNVRYFGVSSYGFGASSKSSEAMKDFRPHRAADPLMWFFSLASIVKHEVNRWR